MRLVLNDFQIAFIVFVRSDFESGNRAVVAIPQGNDVAFPQEAKIGIAPDAVLHALPFDSERMRVAKRYRLDGRA